MREGGTERRTDQRLRTLMASASEGFVAVDHRRVVTMLNEAAETMLKLSRSEIVGRPLADLTLGDLSLAELVQQAERLLRSRRAREPDPVVLVSDDRVLSVSCARYHDGDDPGVVMVIRDDTELASVQERAESILAGAADGLVLFAPDGRVTYLNPAARDMLGRRGRTAIGRRTTVGGLFGLADSEDDDLPGDPGRLTVREYDLPGPKHRVIEARRKCLTDRDGIHIGCVISLRDVTAEREIADMKNEFVSTVSHELRTPLTSIKGYVDLIMDGEAGDINEVQREFLAIVQENSDRLVSLINDLLDISRIESGRVRLRIEPIDIGDVVLDAVETFRAVAEQSGIGMRARVPKRLPKAAGDRDRVGRVLMNLVSNAVKYSPNGGEVTVSANRKGDEVLVHVADQGIGISPEDQKLLFTKFFRVDSSLTRQVGGSGLGLNICKQLVELMGGRIWVRSEPDEGSTFAFSLPLASRTLVRTPGVEGPLGAQGGRVLVVDRDPEVAKLIETYLRKRGYEVLLAHSAKEAVKVASASRPSVITLDVMLDDMDGFDLLQRLKDDPETAAIPVVVLSIVLDEGKSLRLGAADYLEKPIDQDRLVKVVGDLVGSVESPLVLVADDDKGIVDSLSRLLRKRGFAVASAYDGLEAMRAIEADHPDAILLDLRMPKMDGYQVIQQVKSADATKDIPIVVMTAYGIDRSRIDILALAAEQVSKPFDTERLIERVEAVLAKGGATE